MSFVKKLLIYDFVKFQKKYKKIILKFVKKLLYLLMHAYLTKFI